MSPVRMSRIESTVRVALDFKEAFNRHDVEGMIKLMRANCVFESAESPDGEIHQGREAIARYWRDFMGGKKNIRMKGEDVFGLGYRAVMPWRCEWESVTGEKIYIRGVDIFHVNGGLISKQYSYVKGS